MSFHYPENIIFACNDCGICCGDTEKKVRHILLLSNDVKRISEYTKKSILDFAKKKYQAYPYLFEMKKDPKTKKCVFHSKNRCAIYEIRPLICKFYPFELKTDNKGKYIFQETHECPCVKENFSSISSGQELDTEFYMKLFDLAKNELTSPKDENQ